MGLWAVLCLLWHARIPCLQHMGTALATCASWPAAWERACTAPGLAQSCLSDLSPFDHLLQGLFCLKHLSFQFQQGLLCLMQLRLAGLNLLMRTGQLLAGSLILPLQRLQTVATERLLPVGLAFCGQPHTAPAASAGSDNSESLASSNGCFVCSPRNST